MARYSLALSRRGGGRARRRPLRAVMLLKRDETRFPETLAEERPRAASGDADRDASPGFTGAASAPFVDALVSSPPYVPTGSFSNTTHLDVSVFPVHSSGFFLLGPSTKTQCVAPTSVACFFAALETPR